MNLLLLEPADLLAPDLAQIDGRRLQHLTGITRMTTGDTLRVGMLNGFMGQAQIVHLDKQSARLEFTLDTPPPPPLPVTLALALPRPKMIKRTLQTIAAMGVKQLYLIQSERVEKSFWQSSILDMPAIERELKLGLEQGVDTRMPDVHLVRRWRDFRDTLLPSLIKGRRALVAHPRQAAICPQAELQETLLCVGPEGGFVTREVEEMTAAGCVSVHIGQRILRVEVAVPALLSRLFPPL